MCTFSENLICRGDCLYICVMCYFGTVSCSCRRINNRLLNSIKILRIAKSLFSMLLLLRFRQNSFSLLHQGLFEKE